MRKLYLLTIMITGVFSCLNTAYGKADEYLCDTNDENCYQCKKATKNQKVLVGKAHMWDGDLQKEGWTYECRDDGWPFGDWVWRYFSASSLPECATSAPVDTGWNLTGSGIFAESIANNKFVYINVCLKPQKAASAPAETPECTGSAVQFNVECPAEVSQEEHADVCFRECFSGKWDTYIQTCKSGYDCVQFSDGIGCSQCRPISPAGGAKGPAQCTENKVETIKCPNDLLQKHADTCLKQCIKGKWNNAIQKCQGGYDCVEFGNRRGCKECKPKSSSDGPQTNCDAITEAKWDDETQQCVCKDITHDIKGEACVKNPQAELCDAIGDGVAEFDPNTRECRCKDPNMQVDAGTNKCVETDEAKAARLAAEEAARQAAEEAARQAAEAAARQKEAKSKELKDKIEKIQQQISDTKLNTSVWKDKEGNFNTARLVSDSVAGIVVGTAGGLIVSNVVKKNQIKGGFEKLKCSIGGQTVASFGDEFNVGMGAQ